MEFALWTRAAGKQLIERECAIALKVRAVGNYLKRWGFTPQKPIKRAYERRPEAVKAWLADKMEKIEVFYLPSYSPQLNPDERLNADLKYAIGCKVPVRTKIKLEAAATQHMQMLQENPERVKSYFGDPRCAYAAYSLIQRAGQQAIPAQPTKAARPCTSQMALKRFPRRCLKTTPSAPSTVSPRSIKLTTVTLVTGD